MTVPDRFLSTVVGSCAHEDRRVMGGGIREVAGEDGTSLCMTAGFGSGNGRFETKIGIGEAGG